MAVDDCGHRIPTDKIKWEMEWGMGDLISRDHMAFEMHSAAR